MKTLIHLGLFFSLLAAGATQAQDPIRPAPAIAAAPASAAAAQSAPTAEQHVAALRLIKAMRADEAGMVVLKRTAATLPENAKMYAPVLLNDITIEHVRATMSLAYTKFLSAQELNKVAAFYESMAGKKVLDQTMIKWGVQNSPLYPPMSAQDYADVNSFAWSEEARRYLAAQPQVNKEVENQTVKLRQTLFDERIRPAFAQVQQWTADELKARSGVGYAEAPLPVVKDTYTGVPEVDHAVRIIGTIYQQQFQINREYARSTKEMVSRGLLNPQNLVDLETIRRNTVALDKWGAALEMFLKQTAANQEKATADFNSLTDPFGKNFGAGALHSISNTYARTIKLGENQRSILESYRHILAFAEAHHDGMSFADGKLLFAKDEDAQGYNDLIAQLNELGRQEDEIHEETRKSLSKGMDIMKQRS